MKKETSIIIKLKNGDAIIRNLNTNFRIGQNIDTSEEQFIFCTDEEIFRFPMNNIEEVIIR